MKFDKKILKKSLIILTIIMICVTIHKIVQTYALFETNKSGQIEQAIAKWNIELNETDITNGLTEDIIIDNFQLSQNNNVLAGKNAPGISGAVELTLNPKDTDVSIRYDLTLEDLGEQPIKISSIEMIEGTGTLIRTGENTYTGLMNLDKIKNGTANVTVRINVYWENDESNNARDTLIGTQYGLKLRVPINVSVKQYLGENIEEYTDD